MENDFAEWQKIYEAVKEISSLYKIKSFKPWESDGGKQYITIQLVKKDEKELKYLNVEDVNLQKESC